MSYNDGVYEGVANGYHDIITVQVKVSDGKIEKIEYEHKDTPDTGGLAIQHIVEQIIKKQTIDIPRVPGARYSSIGILEAVKKALAVSDGTISQEEAFEIRSQKTGGEYSVADEGDMVTRLIDSPESGSNGKLRFVGGSLNQETLDLLFKELPYHLRVYDNHGRLEFFNQGVDIGNSDFNNIGMHIVDLHEENNFFSKFEEFRTSEEKKLKLSSDRKLVKLRNNQNELKGFLEY